MVTRLGTHLSPYRASLALIATTIATLLAVIDRGLDVTDESMYLYDMKYPGPNSGTHINFITGKVGILFHNNLVVWRVIALVLLVGTSIIFATGILRLCQRLGLFINQCSDRHAKAAGSGFTAAVLMGSLGYYSLGPQRYRQT